MLLNTLSVPIHDSLLQRTAQQAVLAIILLCGTSGVTMAGMQHYQAPLGNVNWQTSSKKLHCTLSHDIPLYGTATFTQTAGRKLEFKLTAKRQASRNRDRAHLRSLPPEWKHQTSVVDLGEIPIHKGNTPFQLQEDLSRRMLAELQKGMFPTFSYRDWADARDEVTVVLPGINIKPVLDEFITCLTNLPVYKFSDFKDSLLHFAFGKSTLNKKNRKRLDELVRYIKTDPQLKYIDITGHTDDIGRRRSNDKLSQQRSQAVKNYLIAKGVSPQLFKLKALGERSPKASNRTDKGRAQNRRAMVRLVK
ncbi:MAG: OmpA family protein [Gammaproteobacteria bacterium]|nr:OmpA family protein [Gammaproteobacteria bacterium]MCF6260082.1 OmpA family protein [Gammaproteobacteria bacterium]